MSSCEYYVRGDEEACSQPNFFILIFHGDGSNEIEEGKQTMWQLLFDFFCDSDRFFVPEADLVLEVVLVIDLIAFHWLFGKAGLIKSISDYQDKVRVR